MKNIPTAPARCTTWFSILIVSAIACMAAAVHAHDGPVDRTVPPLAEPTYSPITELDARNPTPPPRFEPVTPSYRRTSDTELSSCRTARFNRRSVRRSDELS